MLFRCGPISGNGLRFGPDGLSQPHIPWVQLVGVVPAAFDRRNPAREAKVTLG
jgi:hypothetical protein